jgi:hypothetical protein
VTRQRACPAEGPQLDHRRSISPEHEDRPGDEPEHLLAERRRAAQLAQSLGS